jgi:hypothetical protein
MMLTFFVGIVEKAYLSRQHGVATSALRRQDQCALLPELKGSGFAALSGLDTGHVVGLPVRHDDGIARRSGAGRA